MEVSLAPLLNAGFAIKWHAVSAIAALVIGGVQLAGPKGTRGHRVLGYAWAGSMMWVAASSFWIHQFRIVGPWSPIHVLSAIVLVTVPIAVVHAHRGRVAAHRAGMARLYLLALIVTGLFTFLPGRIMYRLLFGQ